MDLKILLLSDRPGWLGRLREHLDRQSQGRATLVESVQPLEGDWDALVVDIESFPHINSLHRRFPWASIIAVSETCSEKERLKHFAAGAQAVCDNLAGLYQSLREAVERTRAHKNDSLSQGFLYHAEKMDAVGRIAVGVAHDFKHLVQVILSGCFLLQKHCKGDEQLLADVSEIRRASDTAHQLVERLLSFASPQPAVSAPTDLAQLVRGYLPILNSLQKSRVRIEVDLVDLPTFPSDPVSIGQILMNLVLNSIDAVADQGQIWVETRLLELPLGYHDQDLSLEPDTYAVLSVSDNGCGLPPELQSKIFEPFFTTRKDQGGTGLGLASVASCIRRLGGGIALESQPGQGTTFQILFPTGIHPRPLEPRSGQILLVGPREDYRALLRHDLESLGLTVCEARRVDAAQVKFAQESFDYCIAEPTQISPDAPPPEVICSGFSSHLLDHHQMRPPGTVLLSRPWDLSLLPLPQNSVPAAGDRSVGVLGRES